MLIGNAKTARYTNTLSSLMDYIHLDGSKMRIGQQLTNLETRWTELISKVLQIEMANVALEAEIERLNKRESELAQTLYTE
jgi:hypothetical protein